MAENYKLLYEAAIKMLAKYQDELIPGFRAEIEKLKAKLAAYENTGLTPELVKSGEINHLQELLKAESEGRLVVLPCKVGQTVYERRHYYDCIDNLYETCELFAYDESACCRCYKNKLVQYIGEASFELSMLEDFGETVFLTREEAEAALNKEGV